MREIEVRLHWGDGDRVVGTLTEHERRVCFDYARAFIEAPPRTLASRRK